MIPKEELKEMYWNQEMTQSEIAREGGVHRNTVQYWMKKYEIRSRTISESKLVGSLKIPKEKLEEMYWNREMSIKEIAKEIGVGRTIILNWMKEYNIISRTQSEALDGKFIGEKNSNWQGGISFEPYCSKFNNIIKEEVRERFDRKCLMCGKDEMDNGRKLCIHHVDYNKMQGCDDHQWKLVPLCKNCHSKTNGNREYWHAYFLEKLGVN